MAVSRFAGLIDHLGEYAMEMQASQSLIVWQTRRPWRPGFDSERSCCGSSICRSPLVPAVQINQHHVPAQPFLERPSLDA